MSWRSRPDAWRCALAIALAAPGVARAQGWRELQAWGVGTAARPAFVGAGIGVAWRDRARTRWSAALAGGARGGASAVRAELAYHFLLSPERTRGRGVYGGGGAAIVAGPDRRPHTYVQVVLGAEARPAGAGGAFVEAGVGGGVRVAIGLRWRKRNAPRS